MINDHIVQNVLSYALEKGAGFAELFVEDKDELSIRYRDSTVQEIAQAHLCGAGIYLITGTQSAYVYLNGLTERDLLRAVDTACELLTVKNRGAVFKSFHAIDVKNPCPIELYPSMVPHSDKIRILREADLAARSASHYLVDLNLGMNDTDQRILVANTEGVWAEDRRVTTRLRLIPTLQNGIESVGNFAEFTGARGYEAFRDHKYTEFVANRIKRFEHELFADECPSAYVPVIFEGGACSGTFFHEACGHQLEASGLREDSLFRHKIGEKIASDQVTLIDDGTLPGQYGSSRFDDEGMPRQQTVLIKDGILTNFLADRMGSIRIGCPRTGSGRRQGYHYAPRARMSNTYLAPGKNDPDEIIRSTPEGLFVTEIGGGTGGDEFTLLAREAFWIKNGQIDRQVKGAMLLGRSDETLMKIDRVGNTLIYEDGGSFCGADSGLVCTTTSGARMRVTEMVVGGKGGKR